MRVALVHDWLTGMRGGEKCLEVFLDMYPDTEIFTLFHVPGSVSPRIERQKIHATFLNSFPRVRDIYRYYLPLFPSAVERLDVRGFDLVVSMSHCVAKGVRAPPDVPHLCYCLTPVRYAWDLYDVYFGPGRATPLVRAVMPFVARRLRAWDGQSLNRVSEFVAISHHVRTKIERFYGRTANVVYPPVDVDRFLPAGTREDFYLIVSALVPYKRIDLAIDAFNALGRRLIVVGKGPEMERLRRRAGPTVTLTGWLPDDEVMAHMTTCRAFVFPGEEEFGITAVEAQAAGAPVIAYGSGGVTESVIGVNGRGDVDGGTGVFFDRQSTESLVSAVREFESLQFSVDALRQNAARFGVEQFRRGLQNEIDNVVTRKETE